jgi:hypothetical protein
MFREIRLGRRFAAGCALAMTVTAVHAAPTTWERAEAATTTANAAESCKKVAPFYWEIGDHASPLVSGSVGGGKYKASTDMNIASSSKWVFGAYASQVRRNAFTPAELQALTMKAGYSSLSVSACADYQSASRSTQTVEQCFEAAANDKQTNADVGKFHYDGGHFQYAATELFGLADDTKGPLTEQFSEVLGADFEFNYTSPQIAGGVRTTPASFGAFLRRILDGDLYMYSALGLHAVCTNPSVCPEEANFTPVTRKESWHYSIGHWVEDDETVGDGAFSSPGAMGFYPWIDATKSWYGILARESYSVNAYTDSIDCGRTIRKAWQDGVPQS